MISHPSLPEVVRNTLRRRILNNELAAGERLIEASLAAEFGVSRTTLRAALMELKNDRLVEFLPRRGCSVARMSRAEVEDACFARYLLESGAACEDRAVIDDDLVASLDKELDVMTDAATAGDLAAIVESDTRLHGLLVEAGGRARPPASTSRPCRRVSHSTIAARSPASAHSAIASSSFSSDVIRLSLITARSSQAAPDSSR